MRNERGGLSLDVGLSPPCGPCAAWREKTFLRDCAPGGVLGELAQQKLDRNIMKLFKHITRLLIAATLLALPVASLAADETKTESALMEPVKSVLDHYLMIQAELAKDSIKGVNEHANAIAKAVKGDDMKMLSTDVAKQAETLAKAKDWKAAREAFKPLSASLIKYLADNKAGKGTYHEAYCPMVKASWLQKETQIRNPYMGKEMLTCGTLKN